MPRPWNELALPEILGKGRSSQEVDFFLWTAVGEEWVGVTCPVEPDTAPDATKNVECL